MQIKFIKSKPEWFQHSIIGGLSYLGIVLITNILAFITTPIGLRSFFEQIIKIIIFPAAYLSLKIVYILVKNPMNYWLPMIILTSFFILIIGALVGYLIYFIKNSYKNLKS